ADGQPIADQPVWLIPTDQPGNPYGVTTDVHGRAWFWCKSGPGTYTAVVQRDGQTHQTQITPAPPGQWLQIKTVRCRLPQ
ncbi:MAG: carboxypeptidase regulatory-like domain-containing protein, partial [Phycisphaerae bacterium]|nr:carboxypeptidase regulatory-like domain-containing protein [Phycisphaerae bacterium]